MISQQSCIECHKPVVVWGDLDKRLCIPCDEYLRRNG